jgi:hypothetical protein
MKAILCALLFAVCLSVCGAVDPNAFTMSSMPDATIECDLCHFIVKEVDSWLAENKTEQFILHEISKICDSSLFQKHSKVVSYKIFFNIEDSLTILVLSDWSLWI